MELNIILYQENHESKPNASNRTVEMRMYIRVIANRNHVPTMSV